MAATSASSSVKRKASYKKRDSSKIYLGSSLTGWKEQKLFNFANLPNSEFAAHLLDIHRNFCERCRQCVSHGASVEDGDIDESLQSLQWLTSDQDMTTTQAAGIVSQPTADRDDQAASSADDSEETMTATEDVDSTSEEQVTELGAHGRPRRKASMGMKETLVPWWKKYAVGKDKPRGGASADGQSASEEDQTSVGVAGGNSSEQRDGVNQGRDDKEEKEEEGDDDEDYLWNYSSSSSDEEEEQVNPKEDGDFDMKDSEDGSGGNDDGGSDSEYDVLDDLYESAEHLDASTVESMLDDKKDMFVLSENGHFACKKCPNQSFPTNRNLLQHLIKHRKEKRDSTSFACKECSFQTTSKSLLERHAEVKHGPQDFQCGQCEYTARRRFVLERHYLRCHASESEKVFVCPHTDCTRRYALELDFKTHLKRHRKTSRVSVPVLCHICGKSVSKAYLAKHIAQTHRKKFKAKSQKRFLCELCGSQFVCKISFDNHKKKHLNIKPFKCQFCGKGFIDSKYRRDHERIHTGEKPFKCKWCDLAFAKRAQLVSHERTHTGEKPYKCSKCKYQSCWNIQLRQHIKAHGAPTEVSCDICQISFISRKSLNIHDKKEHHVTK